MSGIRNIGYLIVFAVIINIGCKKPYDIPVAAANSNYLVVEGVINPGTDSTIIKLSRTVQLSSKIGTEPETNASVMVESDANSTYPLTETGQGYYTSSGLNLNPSNKYHLKITTSDNKVYISDYLPAKNAPPIDSVYYRTQEGGSQGVQIYVDSHDPQDNTAYYRWEFNETYIITSLYTSGSILVKTPTYYIRDRTLEEQVFKCWLTEYSSNIMLGSSASLTKDVITKAPVTFVSSTSEKVASRYSILVKQYALTKEAYSYWQQLKKNTEQLGSIFDAQPSEISGNIHSVNNSSEPVLGYISVGSYSTKRIFVDNYYLPAWGTTPLRPFYDGCTVEPELFNGPNGENQVAINIYAGDLLPINPIVPKGSSLILGYTASERRCQDCTVRGTNIQPSFWTSR